MRRIDNLQILEVQMTVHPLPSLTNPAEIREWMKAVDADLNNIAAYTEKQQIWSMMTEERQRIMENCMKDMALAMDDIAAYFRSITE